MDSTNLPLSDIKADCTHKLHKPRECSRIAPANMFQNNNILRIADKDKLHIDLHKGATKMLLNLLLRLIKQAIDHKFKHPINPSIIKLLQNNPQLIQIKKESQKHS